MSERFRKKRKKKSSGKRKTEKPTQAADTFLKTSKTVKSTSDER